MQSSSSFSMDVAEKNLNEILGDYTNAAIAFVPQMPKLLLGQLNSREMMEIVQLWDVMEERDAAARRYYCTPVRFDGVTHYDRFDDVRSQINQRLQTFEDDIPAEEVGDVTDGEGTGFCMDSGQADDLPGK